MQCPDRQTCFDTIPAGQWGKPLTLKSSSTRFFKVFLKPECAVSGTFIQVIAGSVGKLKKRQLKLIAAQFPE